MSEDEHKCVACKKAHQAAAWYSRVAANGRREYLCGAEYRKFPDKTGWVQTFPGRDD